jgi:Altronate dehydratase
MSLNADAKVLYQVALEDNVATAIDDLCAGEVEIRGAVTGVILVNEAISMGHKIAVKDIAKGEGIRKYNTQIAIATCDIQKGAYVHLHNCQSMIDHRTNTFDVNTATAVDREYKLYWKK